MTFCDSVMVMIGLAVGWNEFTSSAYTAATGGQLMSKALSPSVLMHCCSFFFKVLLQLNSSLSYFEERSCLEVIGVFQRWHI